MGKRYFEHRGTTATQSKQPAAISAAVLAFDGLMSSPEGLSMITISPIPWKYNFTTRLEVFRRGVCVYMYLCMSVAILA